MEVFYVFKDANLHLFLYNAQKFIFIMFFFYETVYFCTFTKETCKVIKKNAETINKRRKTAHIPLITNVLYSQKTHNNTNKEC